jgi:hypothetical protein
MDELRDGEMIEVRMPLLLFIFLLLSETPICQTHHLTNTGLTCTGRPHR